MNIAHVLPYSITFPLQAHNGRYDWVLRLARLQAESGHEVTLYCNPRSDIPGLRTTGIDRASDSRHTNNIETFRVALSNQHDVYHSHFDDLHYEVAPETTRPIVYTQHWWPQEATIRLAREHTSHNVWAVPPTKYMYDFDIQSGIPSKGFIYHGIDLGLFRSTQTQKNDRLLSVGRISPEKNLEIALAVAQKGGFGLDIIGRVADKNRDYWTSLQPMIDGAQIRYLGQKTAEQLVDHYSAARAVIFPSDVNEAFGLVAIEAQACGTPIIMKRGGSRGELVRDGETGFLCETEADYLAAIKLASTVHPSDCIRHARKFDVRVMAKNYEALYKQLLTN